MTRTPALHPVWLLDVDGVINAHNGKPHPPKTWPLDQWLRTRATAGTRSLPILAAHPVVDFIRRVHEDGYAEVRWHTTWAGWTDGLEEVLGLPHLPTQEAPEFLDRGGSLKRGEWWKWPAVRRLIDEGGPLVWADDDIGTELTTEQHVMLAGAPDVLVISPWTNFGLSPSHLAQIGEFLGMEGI